MARRNRHFGGLIGAEPIAPGVSNLGELGGGSPNVINYSINHSLGFDGSTDYLHGPALTAAGAGADGRKKFTISAWVRIDSSASSTSAILGARYLVGGSHNQQVRLAVPLPNYAVEWLEYDFQQFSDFAGKYITPDNVVSPDTWHHIVCQVDTTSTAKVAIWVDGTPQTLTATHTYGDNADTQMSRGTWQGTSVNQKLAVGGLYDQASSSLEAPWTGQLADFHFVDGQALTAADFGETVGGTWYPKAYSGSYGTNGFHLDFDDNNTVAALGNDVSGNNNDFTVNGSLTTGDQMGFPWTKNYVAIRPTRPTRRWAGLIGRGLGAFYSDDPYWSSVKLFLDGTDPLNDLSDLNQDADLTNHNGVTTGTRAGPSGYGNVNVMQFDGTDDFISSSNQSFNFNQDFTLEGWFYVDTHTGSRGFFSHWDGNNSELSGVLVALIDNVNGPGEFVMFAGDGDTWVVNSGVPGNHFVQMDDWNHIACTRSGDTFRMFANGVIVAEETSVGLQVAKSGEFAIGSSQSGSGGIQHLPGDVFDVRITMGVARYTEAFTPPTSRFTTDLQENSIKNTGVVSLVEKYQSKLDAPVYTFEMWGSGGGGGGANAGATGINEHSGPGGSGAHISGTLTGITSGTVLEFLSGAVGVGGINGSAGVATSGGGGGASAIRIKDSDVVAVAGGGGGGGAAGATAAADATGGRGGNSVDGSGVYATDVNHGSGGDGGQSGTSSSAGSHPTYSLANPPTKTEDLQDGGDGMRGNNAVAGTVTNNTNPSGWGGSGGEGSIDNQNEGAGGGGGGGYYAGSGGSGAISSNECGAGGGGGGSYVNTAYVSSYASYEGGYETQVSHDGSAPGASMVKGRGGRGSNYTTDPYTRDGVPGGVYLYKNGVLVKSISHSGDTTTYTIE
jgi:hypothetical protein